MGVACLGQISFCLFLALPSGDETASLQASKKPPQNLQLQSLMSLPSFSAEGLSACFWSSKPQKATAHSSAKFLGSC
jgi:hypothetical protein